MNNKPVLNKAEKIHIHIDSKTFEKLLLKSDRLAIAILNYYNTNYLEFVRSPFETMHDELKNIAEYELMMGDNSEIEVVAIEYGEHKRKISFNYSKKDILAIAKHIYNKERVSKEELATITTTFIQAVFNLEEMAHMGHFPEVAKPGIYITNDETLLENRMWFESHFPGGHLNIMSVSEASIFLDIFFKKNAMYCTSCDYYLNKGFWYWLSMRSKIPHYNVGDTIIDALASKLCYALMALDEITIQFYSGVDNDTMDNTLYHFNYLLSLIAGIFDNLALKTNEHLGINFENKMKVSLSNNGGKDFLRKIKEKNPVLRDHIIDYSNYIKLIYELRHLVVHNEGFSKTRFDNVNIDGWKANFINIQEQHCRQIKSLKDIASEFNPVSKWGIYEMNEIGYFYLEPHYFSIQAITMLVEFVDKYLVLIDYSSFVDDQKTDGTEFAKTIGTFEKYHLGF